MKLLKPAKKETAYLKMGVYGLNGTGKTYTSWLVMSALWHYVKDITKKKPGPIFFADTEAGSDFVYDRFKKDADKIGLLVSKTTAFKDLIDLTDEAIKEGCFGGIVDSITHYWNEMLQSYMEKLELKRITLKHWVPLKTEWKKFSRLRFVNSPLHMILCGRSADLWEEVEDEEGITELKQKGTRMKAEGEMGHESNLLVEMDITRVGPSMEHKYVHRAWVRKDKFDILNFQKFDDPTLEAFMPHIKRLNLGGKHLAIDTSRNSKDMFEKGMGPGYRYMKEKEILLEQINTDLYLVHPGQDKESKLGKIRLQQKFFKTNSWEKIKSMDNPVLEDGYKKLHVLALKAEKERSKENAATPAK